ncbi:hypothetical protein Indivirus_6_48 [Indivirus ILV1]|uniref:C2H2-type domain-containing protein n=1 Tax=Indivirus ILV1 TaxID=1977633 RepID=A0A1V0SE52_9VIRU|nr:hypothetical protein Indivirus_6_48 [Indivirus ILV1]
MGEFNFLDLPEDVIIPMINNIFDPITSLKCLRVCKRLNELGNRSKIIYRVLMFNMKSEFQRQLDKMILCPKCFIKLDNETSLKKHLYKHAQAERKNNILACHNPFKRGSCRYCKGPTSNLTNHVCLLSDYRTCLNSRVIDYYDWADSLCCQGEFYMNDPNYLEHKCKFRCKVCKEVVDNSGEGGSDLNFDRHFQECPFRNKIIEIYQLKNDNEGREFFEKVSEGQPYELEQLFETEYLEWKNTQIQEEKFVQESYKVLCHWI